MGNDSKDVNRQYRMESLGYVTNGEEGRQDLPAGYTRDLVALTLWMCSRPAVSQRNGQVLAGRWVRAQQVCRATSGPLLRQLDENHQRRPPLSSSRIVRATVARWTISRTLAE